MVTPSQCNITSGQHHLSATSPPGRTSCPLPRKPPGSPRRGSICGVPHDAAGVREGGDGGGRPRPWADWIRGGFDAAGVCGAWERISPTSGDAEAHTTVRRPTSTTPASSIRRCGRNPNRPAAPGRPSGRAARNAGLPTRLRFLQAENTAQPPALGPVANFSLVIPRPPRSSQQSPLRCR